MAVAGKFGEILHFDSDTKQRVGLDIKVLQVDPDIAYIDIYRLRWSRGSVLAFSTQVRGLKPGRNRRIFRAKKSSAHLPSEGK